MMLSESSSSSFSQSLICCSRCSFRILSSCSISSAFSSRSKSFIAYQRRFCGSTIEEMLSSICATACSTLPVNTCGSSCPAFDFACSMAFFATSRHPVLLSALIGRTGQSSSLLSFPRSIRSPFFVTRSIMFKAMTVGMCSSRSCVVRYRFRSILVPSIMLMMASGFSLTR